MVILMDFNFNLGNRGRIEDVCAPRIFVEGYSIIVLLGAIAPNALRLEKEGGSGAGGQVGVQAPLC